MNKVDYYIHETAIVDDDVAIGRGTKVWAFTHLCRNVKVGENCTIGEGVYIGPNVRIGDNVKIQNHALLYEGVTIEEGVFIGPNVVTTNDIMPRSQGDWTERFRETVFHKGCSVGANSTIVCGINIGANAMIGAGSVVTKTVPSTQLWFGNPAVYRKTLK